MTPGPVRRRARATGKGSGGVAPSVVEGARGIPMGEVRSARTRTTDVAARRVPFRALLALVLALASLAIACAPTTTELSSDDPDGYPEQSPDGYPAPQVMAEVTLPDGSVASVPQPVVPETTIPSAAVTTPAALPRVPTTVVTAADDRAVQQLTNAAAIQAAGRALGLLRFDWRLILPGWQIRFLPGRSGIRGATYPDRKVIEIYVRSSDGPDDLAHVVAHELGHALDVTRLDDADRQVWRATRGINPNAAWFPSGSGAPDYSTPAGDWAESFAHWQVGSGWYSKLGKPPDAAQIAVLARLAGLG